LEVNGSVACIWRGDRKRQFSSEGISWLSDRNIRIRLLWVRDPVNHDTAMMIASFGVHLLQLDINENCVNDINMITIVEGCRNIEILGISDCQSITDIDICRIAGCCPHLNQLHMKGCHDITDTSIIKVAEYCHSIEALNIENCVNITDTGVIKLAEHCPHIKELYMLGCHNITDTVITNLTFLI
jgi:F-box/leucine-rich repeat protein 2/20